MHFYALSLGSSWVGSPFCHCLCVWSFAILRQEVCRSIAGGCCPVFRSHDISLIVLSGGFFVFDPMLRLSFVATSEAEVNRVSTLRLNFCRHIVGYADGGLRCYEFPFVATSRKFFGTSPMLRFEFIGQSEDILKRGPMLRQMVYRMIGDKS